MIARSFVYRASSTTHKHTSVSILSLSLIHLSGTSLQSHCIFSPEVEWIYMKFNWNEGIIPHKAEKSNRKNVKTYIIRSHTNTHTHKCVTTTNGFANWSKSKITNACREILQNQMRKNIAILQHWRSNPRVFSIYESVRIYC